MENPIKQIKLNNLEYNANRDPQVYRRSKNKPFDLKVLLTGTGSAKVSLSLGNETVSEETVSLPGAFSANPSFDSAGTRVGTLTVEKNNEKIDAYIRFDVLEEDYKG